MIPRPSLSRSYLIVPGDDYPLVDTVFESGADAVVLDLADSVALDQKKRAREIVGAAIRSRRRREGPRIFVRINPVSIPFWKEDVKQVVAWALDGIRLAKAISEVEIEALDRAISEAEKQAGMPNHSICVVPSIESAVGVISAGRIAQHPRIEGFSFEAMNFANDVGAEVDSTGVQTIYAESHLVLISRAAGIRPPVASVYLPADDLKGLYSSSLSARGLGFFGRSCIHPTQLPTIHEVFTPSAKQLADANAILESFQRGQSQSNGAFRMDDGRFVDQVVVRRAREIVALKKRLTQLSESTGANGQ